MIERPSTQILTAEFVGTAVLVLVGPGAAIIASDRIGALGVSLAFGFAVLGVAYALGHVSGAHLNPAVSLAFVLNGKLDVRKALFYWGAQVAGAVAAAFALWCITDTGNLDTTGVFAANGWGSAIGSDYSVWAAIGVEVIFTAMLVFVVLSTGTEGFLTGFDGLAVGITLAMIHLVTIPVDNTSVNPARSIATALFSGTEAIGQVWVFIVFPLVGALVGTAVWAIVHAQDLELRRRQW